MASHANARRIMFRSAALGAYASSAALLAAGYLIDVDIAVRDRLRQTMPRWAVDMSGFAAHLGQGGPLAGIVLAIAVVQSRRLRTLKPIVSWVATSVLLTAFVGPAKIYFRRGAPADSLVNAVEFYSKDFCGTPACQSYPSGHAANAVAWYGLAMLLVHDLLRIGFQRAIRLAAVTVTAFATIISGYHWMTDTMAGIFAGLGVYYLVQHIHLADLNYLRTIDRRIFD